MENGAFPPAGYTVRSVWEAPLKVYGCAPNETREFCRLPLSLLPECTPSVRHLAYHTAGMCVRFSTDSPGLALSWTLRYGYGDPDYICCAKGNLTACMQSGMELFEETDRGVRQIVNFLPPVEREGVARRQTAFTPLPKGLRHYALYLPLYNGIEEMRLGFSAGATVAPGRAPRLEKPLVFYGSSITQGGCASKAGSCFAALLARRMDAALVNLGFCGAACGEECLARFIAGMEMSVFILDYDHNAPNWKGLRETQRAFYAIVRQAQPRLPILMVSRPGFDLDPTAFGMRRDVILENYLTARKNGDRHVYFADGSRFFGNTDRDLCTIDGVHPTDVGHLRMADSLEPLLRLALEEKEENA